MGNLQHDLPKTGGWGAFYRKQQVEKKAAGSIQGRLPAHVHFVASLIGDSDVRMR
jgi:activator of HSP90 ATPase